MRGHETSKAQRHTLTPAVSTVNHAMAMLLHARQIRIPDEKDHAKARSCLARQCRDPVRNDLAGRGGRHPSRILCSFPAGLWQRRAVLRRRLPALGLPEPVLVQLLRRRGICDRPQGHGRCQVLRIGIGRTAQFRRPAAPAARPAAISGATSPRLDRPPKAVSLDPAARRWFAGLPLSPAVAISSGGWPPCWAALLSPAAPRAPVKMVEVPNHRYGSVRAHSSVGRAADS